MIIYKIQNKIDGKIYIGQTLFSFRERYGGGKWWKITSCKHLKRAAAKYGHENFSIEILEKNVKSAEILDELERFYIKKFNCMEPNGYNINSGGESKHFYSNEQKTALAKAKRGTDFFELKNQITGEIRKIENAKLFAEQEGISDGQVCDVAKGNIMSVKNWTLPHITLRYWILENEDGRREKVLENTGASFCRKEGLNEQDFQSLVRGMKRNGWRVVFFQPRVGWIPKKQKPRTHSLSKHLESFLLKERNKEKFIYFRDIVSGFFFKVEDSFFKCSRIKQKLSLKCSYNAISAYLLNKRGGLLENRIVLCDETGFPIRKIKIHKTSSGKEKFELLTKLFGERVRDIIY